MFTIPNPKDFLNTPLRNDIQFLVMSWERAIMEPLTLLLLIIHQKGELA